MIFRWFYCNIKARFVKRSLFEKAANASPIRNIRRFAFASATLSNARPSPFFAQAYRPCHGFRGSTPWLNAEAALRSPPNLRQRVECGTGTAGLSGLSSRCGGAGVVRMHIPAKSTSTSISTPTPAKPGHTERPAELQFMVRRVVRYSTKFSCIARRQAEPALPASRPQAARKMWKRHCRRVACAKRRGSRHGRLSGLSSRCGGGVLSLAALGLGLRSAMRFCCRVLPSVHACCLSRDKQNGLR